MGDYLGNYKGGRNESFMYGIDKKTYWYDYDLISAYTTVMYALGHPVYGQYKRLGIDELNKRYKETPESLIFSYIIVKGSFEFPETVNYPSIPVYADDVTTVYPLSGECNLTGSEYVLARNQGCEIKVDSVVEVPFLSVKKDKKDKEDKENKEIAFFYPMEKNEVVLKDQPYASVIMNIQRRRRASPKGSLQNTMDKLLGNSMYGLVVQGISHKKHFDIPSDSLKRMDGSVYSNAILAS